MSSASSEPLDWRFSLRIALAMAALFAASVIAVYLMVGTLLERSLAREELALLQDRAEDVRLAWQEGGSEVVAAMLQESEAATGEELATRVTDATGRVLAECATLHASGMAWPKVAGSSAGNDTESSWIFCNLRLPDGSTLQVARHSTVAAEVRQAFNGIFTRTAVPLLVGAVVLATIFTALALRPVRRAVAVMRRIVRTGNWQERVEVPAARGDMRNLAEAFNALLERQRRLVEDLRLSLDHVAHDLKTPLARLRNAAVEGADAADPALMREALANCIEETDRVRATLDTLLDVAEAEAGAVQLRREHAELAPICREVAELYGFIAEEKGVAIEVRIEGDPAAWIDRVRVRRCLANLVDNALKYIGSGRRVEIAARVCEGEVEVSVTDDGIGILDTDLGRVWDRLYRADASRSSPGMGLGLSLVKAIVEAHGGRVSAASAPGRGSCFTLVLPVRAVRPAGTAAPHPA
ncbi:ATP-binding protein [Nibricoccus sp. IMCC34717]|uniref:sensor histidine kinase n=1 Tax=Nibricoccus sp. IMCC34717 TaxID=3034021 RepID=UPI00384FF825